MDSEDKKDIIRTVKKKSEEPEEEMDSSEEDEFDFEGMEESYDNYMDDDDMDGMDNYSWDGGNEFSSYRHKNSMRGTKTKESYDDYDSYMEDIIGSDNQNDEYSPNRRTWESKEEDTELGGDEDDIVARPNQIGDDMLLLDIDEEMDDEDFLYKPKRNRRYDRSDISRAKRQADKDISKHYYKPTRPNYENGPVEKWAKHKLPYDMDFMDESRGITEDHFNDRMETYEQEKAYEDMEKLVRRYGMDLGWCHKETTEDPEESIIYLDIIDGSKKLLKVRINSVGSIEVGEMTGKNFVGEPLDSVEDFIEIYGEDLTNKEREEMLEDFEMNQPKRSPETQPNEPTTKPGKPERRSPSERPSRRPFTPPPHIKPGDEPNPKADYDDEMDDPFMSPSPAPSKPSPSKEPVTKPGTPEKTPGRERPSRRPFTPPPHIKPGDEPNPKAGDNDIEFE